MIKHILCVDDDPIALLIIKRVIKKYSFAEKVECANDGQQAIDYLKMHSQKTGDTESSVPDLVLLDLNMPVMNGWEFLNEYKESISKKIPELKIAILSSSIDPNDKERSGKYPNVLGFYSKPLSREDLEDIQDRLQ